MQIGMSIFLIWILFVKDFHPSWFVNPNMRSIIPDLICISSWYVAQFWNVPTGNELKECSYELCWRHYTRHSTRHKTLGGKQRCALKREARVCFKQGTKGALYKKGAKHWCSKKKEDRSKHKQRFKLEDSMQFTISNRLWDLGAPNITEKGQGWVGS